MRKYLIRAINRNQAILFLGAGFSTLAKNQRGESLPTSARFAELLWGFLGYPPPYDTTSSLAELYEALLASGKPLSVISDFLTSNLLSVDTPREYQEIVKVFWSRIYTTNIDNLLEQIYALVTTPRLDIRSFPRDELPDRDVTLEWCFRRCICTDDYRALPRTSHSLFRNLHAEQLLTINLYDHFVRDYATKTTVSFGTALNEPLLWQYIEIRKARRADIGEERPRSFLISPVINAPKRQLLQAMNVVPVVASTGDFLAWLATKGPEIASRDDVLQVTIPGLVELVSGAVSGQARDVEPSKSLADTSI